MSSSNETIRAEIPVAPELIVKESIWMLDRDDEEIPIPALLLFGNSGGFRYLAELFNLLADQAELLSNEATLTQSTDPDKHEDLRSYDEPFNLELSDAIHVRCGLIGPLNRAAILEKWNISSATQRAGDLTERLEVLIDRGKRLSKLRKGRSQL